MRGDVFGAKGDFVTSPEISQVFGELVGVWATLQYEALGSPETLRVIEFGPGRGTLMADLLRGTSKFKKFTDAMSVHLIEVSPALRKIQAETLQCEDVETTNGTNRDGFRVPVNVTRDEMKDHADSTNRLSSPSSSSKIPVGEARARGTSSINGASVSWHDGLESVPSGPTLVIAHEFFDALPVRQFQRTERGWCEKLVTINSDLLEDDAADAGKHGAATAAPKPEKVPGRELEIVLSPGPTPASHMLVSRRLNGLPKDVVEGLRLLELSPPSLSLWDRLAERIEEHSGAVLAIDYGEEGPLGDTLEAIKDHKFVHVLDSPGEADLSAYVDFGALRQIIDEKPHSGVTCHGPITQQQFLLSLGLISRLEKLVENATSDAQADELIKGCERLVSDSKGDAEAHEPPGMGARYKAMCLVSRGVPKPVGF
jgi:NADH dehydrogenase [ubiquinone] 1 alpha subcomplex assembly factor 7